MKTQESKHNKIKMVAKHNLLHQAYLLPYLSGFNGFYFFFFLSYTIVTSISIMSMLTFNASNYYSGKCIEGSSPPPNNWHKIMFLLVYAQRNILAT